MGMCSWSGHLFHILQYPMQGRKKAKIESFFEKFLEKVEFLERKFEFQSPFWLTVFKTTTVHLLYP